MHTHRTHPTCGHRLATVSADRTIRVWSTGPDMRQLSEFDAGGDGDPSGLSR